MKNIIQLNRSGGGEGWVEGGLNTIIPVSLHGPQFFQTTYSELFSRFCRSSAKNWVTSLKRETFSGVIDISV